jgi:uncharacterized protein YndB with AHSA1/START domain
VTIQRKALIAAPVAHVYAMLADADRLPEWREDLVSTERISPPGDLNGAKYKETLRTPLGNQTATVQLSTEAGKTFGFKVLDGPIRPQGTLTMTPSGDGTELVYRIELKPLFGFPSPLDTAAGIFMTTSVDKSMKKLKEILEAGAAS